MHHMQLEGMAKKLVEAGLVEKDKLELAVKNLGEYWEDTIAVIWSTQDVISYAESQDLTISENTAKDILDRINNNHDCNDGISWNSFDYYLEEDEVLEESRVRQTEPEDLPLLINEIKTAEGQEALEERLKEVKCSTTSPIDPSS